MCDNTESIANQDTHLSFGTQNFLGVLLCKYDWFSHWPHSWTQSLVPSQRLACYNVTQSPNPSITWLVFLVWPAPILSHFLSRIYLEAHCEHLFSINYEMWPGGFTTNNKDIRKFRGFAGYHLGSGDKGQPIPLLHVGDIKYAHSTS